MRFRILLLGRVDDELRRELSALGDGAEILDVAPLGDAGDAIEDALPHLLVLGEDSPRRAASFGPGGSAGLIPVISVVEEPGADLVLAADAARRPDRLRTALKLARLREAWLTSITAEGDRLRLRIEQEFLRAARYRHPLCLAVLAIDGVEDLARTHGHPAVHAFTDSLADAARRGVREVDILFRPSRSEVWAILPETEIAGARTVAERLRALTGRVLFKPPRGGAERPSLPFKATGSVGLASCPAEGIGSATELIAAARAALDAARHAGGDRVALPARS